MYIPYPVLYTKHAGNLKSFAQFFVTTVFLNALTWELHTILSEDQHYLNRTNILI